MSHLSITMNKFTGVDLIVLNLTFDWLDLKMLETIVSV